MSRNRKLAGASILLIMAASYAALAGWGDNFPNLKRGYDNTSVAITNLTNATRGGAHKMAAISLLQQAQAEIGQAIGAAESNTDGNF